MRQEWLVAIAVTVTFIAAAAAYVAPHPSSEECYDLGGAVEISHEYCVRDGVPPTRLQGVVLGRMVGLGGAGLLAGGIAALIIANLVRRYPAASG